MVDYCLGFIFDKDFKNVMLIEKQRPKWQKNRLNGIGGHVELNETFTQAMAREMAEETGVVLEEKDFTHYADMIGSDWKIAVYWAVLDPMYFLTLTDEVVGLYSVDDVMLSDITFIDFDHAKLNVIENLPFLISRALMDANIEGFDTINTDFLTSANEYTIDVFGEGAYVISTYEGDGK